MKTRHHYKADIRWSDEDKAFIARAPELSGVLTHGDTLEHAARMLDEAIELHLESLRADEQPIPEPITLQNLSGKYPLRMSKDLHEDIVIAAARAGKSVNEYIISRLSEPEEEQGEWVFVRSPMKKYNVEKKAKSPKRRRR